MNQREPQPATVVQYASAAEAQASRSRVDSSRLGPSSHPPTTPPRFSTLLARALAAPAQADATATEATSGTGPTVDTVKLTQPGRPSALDRFMQVEDCLEQLAMWFGPTAVESGQLSMHLIIAQLQRDIALIDRLLTVQLNAVLHHTDFQKLEASWRGLEHLTHCQDRWTGAQTFIKVLNVSWGELRDDFDNANDYDQSVMYKKIHQEGLGQAGAYPYSAMLLDYEIHPKPNRDYPYDDIEILTRMAEVGQAAFCPMIASADPSMFDEECFADLRPPNGASDAQRREEDPYEQLHNSLGFFRWKKFRSEECARFMSLAMPRMLMRRPYRSSYSRYFGFGFEEEVRRGSDYLWGSAAYGVGEVLLRTFSEGSWFADIRGAQRGSEQGGRVLGPTFDSFQTEPHDSAIKPVTEMVISDDFERTLSKLGFMPLCSCKDMPVAAFYSSATVQKPALYNDEQANFNSRISAMLNYMLCASRFAHYVKLITRDRIGSCNGPEDLERLLQNWLAGYITDSDAALSIRAEKPLRDAQIKVWAVPGTAGEFKSVLHVAPHFGFEDVNALVVLKDQRLVSRNK